ncbi:MAG: hypothetical protein ACI8PD_002286 [Nitrospinales bacterium]|jgi:hypothetical protein
MACQLLFYLIKNELWGGYLKEIACSLSILLEAQEKIIL